MPKRYKSEPMAAIHETAQGLHKVGAIDSKRMRKFDQMCLADEAKKPTKFASRKSTALQFQVFKDARGEWRWRLQAGNGKSIASSGEGYKSKKDCLSAIDLVKHANLADVVKEVIGKSLYQRED